MCVCVSLMCEDLCRFMWFSLVCRILPRDSESLGASDRVSAEPLETRLGFAAVCFDVRWLLMLEASVCCPLPWRYDAEAVARVTESSYTKSHTVRLRKKKNQPVMWRSGLFRYDMSCWTLCRCFCLTDFKLSLLNCVAFAWAGGKPQLQISGLMGSVSVWIITF